MGRDMVVSRYAILTGILRIDGLSAGPPVTPPTWHLVLGKGVIFFFNYKLVNSYIV